MKNRKTVAMKSREQMKYEFLRARRKDAARTEYDIIRILASEGTQTVDQISQRMKKHWIVVKTRIGSLEQRGFVRLHRKEPKRQGKGDKTFYMLTFRGLVGYFSSIYLVSTSDYAKGKTKEWLNLITPLTIEEVATIKQGEKKEEKFTLSELKKEIPHIMKQYGQILDYPIFKNWDFFVKRWGDYPYSWLLLGSFMTHFTEPFSHPIFVPRKLEEMEDHYKHGLAYEFFSLMLADTRIAVKPITFNSSLVDFITEVLEKQREKLNVELKRFEMLERLTKTD